MHDNSELDAFVASQMPKVRAMLERRIGRGPNVDDLVQLVFLEFCRALPRFRGDSSLSTFLCGFAIRIARRARRPSGWDRRRISIAGTKIEQTARDENAGPEREVLAREQVRRLRRALTSLTPPKRTAFLLWSVEGRTPEEISSMTKATPAAVRSRIYFAQKELAKKASRDPYLSDFVAAA